MRRSFVSSRGVFLSLSRQQTHLRISTAGGFIPTCRFPPFPGNSATQRDRGKPPASSFRMDTYRGISFAIVRSYPAGDSNNEATNSEANLPTNENIPGFQYQFCLASQFVSDRFRSNQFRSINSEAINSEAINSKAINSNLRFQPGWRRRRPSQAASS